MVVCYVLYYDHRHYCTVTCTLKNLGIDNKKLVHLGVRIKDGDPKQFQVCTCIILGLVIYEYKLGDAIMMLHIFNNMHNILQKLLHIM